MNNNQELGVGSREYKKILMVRLDRIGDVLLSTPAIKAVRDAYPDSHIAFMVQPYAKDIVEGNPYLNEVICYDKGGREGGLFGNLGFIMKLRQKKFELAIILHPTVRTHIVTLLAGIGVRAGFDKKMGFLLTNRIPHLKELGDRHEIDYTLDILKNIGIAPKDRSLYMPLKSESEERVKNIFNRNNIKDTDMVISVNPGASCASKRWSAERFARVSDSIIERYGARVIILAGMADKFFGDRTASLIRKGCINLSGNTSVADLASVLKRSRLFISNDSGPVHIACAIGTPVVAIFGRSDKGLSPKRWGPSGKYDIVLHKYVGCDVCLAHNCNIGFKCLEAITVNDVLAAVEKILSQSVKREEGRG